MQILVAPDSFKGSGSAELIGNTIKAGLQKELPEASIDVIPMADGGEGTIDSILYSTNGSKVYLDVTGPTGQKLEVYYGILHDSKTVIIEIATIVGLTLIPDSKKTPMNLTTYGIGECVLHALDSGYRKFIFCLGGSATNDGGLGMLQALGAKLKDQDGTIVSMYSNSLAKIRDVDYSGLDERIKESEIKIASDVTNPLFGKNGATYIFGPQKGLKEDELNKVDKEMKEFSLVVEKHIGKTFHTVPGSGAAGGLGFALLTIGGLIESGAELIARSINLDVKMPRYDWVITGEGQTDQQTLQGKLPFVIAKMAEKHSIPSILISGSVENETEQLYDVFTSMYSITNGPLTLEESINNMESLLSQCSRNIARLLKFTTNLDCHKQTVDELYNV